MAKSFPNLHFGLLRFTCQTARVHMVKENGEEDENIKEDDGRAAIYSPGK